MNGVSERLNRTIVEHTSETIGRRAAPTEILALIIALIGRSVGVLKMDLLIR